MSNSPIYLDCAATTPLDPRVLVEMQPYLTNVFGNPSSLHSFGRQARRAIAHARRQTAEMIGAFPEEIFFTGGGTESDNWALRGIAAARRAACGGTHIVTSAIEHHAVLETCRFLETEGFTVTYLPVDGEGRVSPSDVEAALRGETVLVSIMTANNEVGTIQPIAEIAEIAHARGILLHTDAVQAAGHIPLNVCDLQADALSFSAHKFCGPKGIGVLYVRRGTPIAPLLYGGGQERDMRAGTENVAAIVGCGAAAALARTELDAEGRRLREASDFLRAQLSALHGVTFHGASSDCLPGILNFSVRGIARDSLLIRLDLAGFAVSAGSACSAGAAQPSHVLDAMGISAEESGAAIRVSLGRFTSDEDVHAFAEIMAAIVSSMY